MHSVASSPGDPGLLVTKQYEQSSDSSRSSLALLLQGQRVYNNLVSQTRS
jgi:hypothetical protein